MLAGTSDGVLNPTAGKQLLGSGGGEGLHDLREIFRGKG
jgi:hypothetical protein